MASNTATAPLHELLRTLREGRGQSLREVARDLDVDPAYLSRIERGTKAASSAMLERASTYYDVPEELLALSRGTVPPDVIAILQANPQLLVDLRERYGSE